MSNPESARARLLARHQSAAPQLDRLRGDLVAALSAPSSMTWRELLAALFRPHRVTWRALAGVWLALALLHFTRDRVERPSPLPAPSPEAFAVWLDQLKSHETFAQMDHRF